MSLEIDGVWKAGVWAPTVWAAGVWREGALAEEVLPDSPHHFPLVAPASMPGVPDFAMMPRDSKVDADFFALARIASAQSYLDDVGQWITDQLADGEELAIMDADDSFAMDEALSGKRR